MNAGDADSIGPYNNMRIPVGAEEDSPYLRLFDWSTGSHRVFVTGLPGTGKTNVLQDAAMRNLNSDVMTFWWGEARPQWRRMFPDNYQLLVEDGLDVRLFKQWDDRSDEEEVRARKVTGLKTEQQFFEAAQLRALNVLVFQPTATFGPYCPEHPFLGPHEHNWRADRLLSFLEWMHYRRGLKRVATFLDETGKLAPGTCSSEDGSYRRGLRLARIIEDSRSDFQDLWMTSHAPADLLHVCLKKIETQIKFAGKPDPSDRHSPAAHDALSIGECYVEGPTAQGRRFDLLKLAPPSEPPFRLILRITGESSLVTSLRRAPPPPHARVVGGEGPSPGRSKVKDSCPRCGARVSHGHGHLARHLRDSCSGVSPVTSPPVTPPAEARGEG